MTTCGSSSKPAPYHDELGPDGLLHYRYRGTDPGHRDNVGMKRAMQREAPLIYLFGIVAGEYLPIWPVYVAGFDDAALTFKVAVEDERLLTEEVADFEEDLKRAYVARVVVQRLHQQSFRRRVLRAVVSASVGFHSVEDFQRERRGVRVRRGADFLARTGNENRPRRMGRARSAGVAASGVMGEGGAP